MKFGYMRTDVINDVPHELVFYEPIILDRKESWEKQSEYAFVLSPHGNGLDCHRTWEALILGCIPIVRTSPIDSLYEGLPVLIVNDWNNINNELLQNTIDQFKNMSLSCNSRREFPDNLDLAAPQASAKSPFSYEKLTLSFWMDKINSS